MLSTPRCCTSLAAPMHRTVTSQPQSNLHARSRVSHCALPPAFIDLADLLQEPTIKIAAPAGLALLGAGASVLAARAAVYARLQYVLASLLGTRVPSGTTTVLQLGGSARDLYYLPNGVQRVTVVDPAAKAGYWEQAGMAAGVPVELRTQAPQTLLFARDASVGAVVATTPLDGCSDLQQLVGEVARVLQPGGTFVFMQRLAGGPVQRLVGDPSRCVDAGALEAALEAWEDAFDRIEIDMSLQGIDSHVVGVATRSSTAVGKKVEDEVLKAEQLRRRKRARGG